MIWVSVFCLLAIGLLIGIPVLASMMVNRGKGDGDKIVQNDPDVSAQKNNPTKTDPQKNQPKKGNRKKTKKKPKADRTVKNFTAEEFRSIWSKCYSGIVLVNAKFGSENKTSHGVVMSNDGRIAVSLSQVSGADSVRVRFALPSYGEKERWTKPIAVTTIASSKPELNLAILQVSEKTKTVPNRTQPVKYNDRGVIPILSNNNSTEFLRLTKLRPAKPFDDLSEDEQAILTSLSLTPEGNDYFGVHSAKLNKNGMGAPVFDEQGQLVGMHLTHHTESKNSFLIPPAVIRKVMNDPLAKPSTIGSDASRKAATTKKENGPQNSPSKESGGSATFAGALKGMSDLKWQYATDSGYPAAQALAISWWNVNAEYLKADFTRRNRIEDLKKQMATDMDENLFWPNKQDQKKVNESAIQAFRDKARGWLGAISVLKPAGLTIDVDGEPAILVQLVETDQKALLVPGEVEGPFLQGTEWLVFGINKSNTRLNTSDGKCMVIHLAGVKKK